MLWFICIIVVCFYYCVQSMVKPRNYPPGPVWLPWLGSALITTKLKKKYDNEMHAAFQDLAKQHDTDILGLKLGPQIVVVVFNETSLKVLQNPAFDGRPDNFFFRLRTMGQRKGVTFVDGPLWEEHRQFIIKNLRGHKSSMDNYILQEVTVALQVISKNNLNVDISTVLSKRILNILWVFLFGKPLGCSNERIKTLVSLMQKRDNAFDMSGGILNVMPWLRYIAPDRTGYNLINQLNSELYHLFTDMISEHTLENDNEDNLVNSYLVEINKSAENSTFTKDQLILVCFDFFIAGSVTITDYLNLAFLAMLHYPEVQHKVQTELESVVGKRQVTISDRKNTPYAQAVIYELSRFQNMVNILGPRRSLIDVNLNGYVIPKDTTVLISIKSLHTNSAYWNEPDFFRPERFLNEENKLINTEKIKTFGLGRRRCLGDYLSKNCIYLLFCGILQRYKIESADGKLPTDKLQHGIFSIAYPYKVNFIPT